MFIFPYRLPRVGLSTEIASSSIYGSERRAVEIGWQSFRRSSEVTRTNGSRSRRFMRFMRSCVARILPPVDLTWVLPSEIAKIILNGSEVEYVEVGAQSFRRLRVLGKGQLVAILRPLPAVTAACIPCALSLPEAAGQFPNAGIGDAGEQTTLTPCAMTPDARHRPRRRASVILGMPGPSASGTTCCVSVPPPELVA